MFPQFPHFSPLKLEDKDLYNGLISKYPPLSDIAFPTLHIWWSLEGNLELSMLHDNLVINYHLPFDSENSGLSIIGNEKIDESVETVLKHLEKSGQPVRLVHIPEFVIRKLDDKDIYNIVEEIDYNEYILDSFGLSALDGASYGRIRRHVNRFLREVENSKVEVATLDLGSESNINAVFDSLLEWEKSNQPNNDPKKTEHHAIKRTLQLSTYLDTKHLALYIDGKMHGIVLYHKSLDSNYYTINHLKVDYSTPFIFDYITHLVAKDAANNNAQFLNIEMDLGIENLRRHKMGLRPVEFFRKYTISRATQE